MEYSLEGHFQSGQKAHDVVCTSYISSPVRAWHIDQFLYVRQWSYQDNDTNLVMDISLKSIKGCQPQWNNLQKNEKKKQQEKNEKKEKEGFPIKDWRKVKRKRSEENKIIPDQSKKENRKSSDQINFRRGK